MNQSDLGGSRFAALKCDALNPIPLALRFEKERLSVSPRLNIDAALFGGKRCVRATFQKMS
jgi:hypothetical protein